MSGKMPKVVHSDCRTKHGTAIGLVDGIIATARVLRKHFEHVLDAGALEDLRTDEDVAWLLGIKLPPPEVPSDSSRDVKAWFV